MIQMNAGRSVNVRVMELEDLPSPAADKLRLGESPNVPKAVAFQLTTVLSVDLQKGYLA